MGGRVEGKIKKKSIKAKVTSKFSGKRKLSRMGKKVKKGMMGPSTEFMTRSAVINKLQITLKDFRRLCILKGIYPRVPTKAPKGSDKIYYDIKDISYLSHEPLLAKFREFKTFMKKIRKAAGRNQVGEARRKDSLKPTMSLDHLVKERYPRFNDALRDLDDALCMIHLFASLPSIGRVTPERTNKCSELVRHWQYYIAKSKTLRKVFVSVKGVYLQAEILGEPVTWLVPHQFTQEIPREVDLRVMMTFLEFYEVFIRFTLFKLYHMQGLRYPPVLDKTLNEAGCCLLAVKTTSLEAVLEPKDVEAVVAADATASSSSSLRNPLLTTGKSKALAVGSEKLASLQEKLNQLASGRGEEEEDEDAEEELEMRRAAGPLADAFAAINGDAEDDREEEERVTFAEAETAEGADSSSSRLFRNLVFFVNREVPLDWLQLCVLSCAGRLGWEGALSPFTSTDPSITHHIVDRPIQGNMVSSREYVQPQWVFDSINAQMLLPTHAYRANAKLPPHLSPFVDDAKVGYQPKYREEIQQLKEASNPGALEAPAKKEELDHSDDGEDAVDEDAYAAEVRAERDAKNKAKQQGKQIKTAAPAVEKGKGKAKVSKKVAAAPELESDEEDEEETPASRRVKAGAGGDSKAASKGTKAVVFQPQVPKLTEDEETAELSKVMMSKKSKRLYDRMQHGIAEKEEQVQRLEEKRAAAEKKAGAAAAVTSQSAPDLRKRKVGAAVEAPVASSTKRGKKAATR